MAANYIVQQGDFLSKIAKAFGFGDYRAIWFHPNNAELNQRRINPNVLFPGDILFIPDRRDRIEHCPTDQKHKFVKHAPSLKLRMVLEDMYEKPIAGATCILTVAGNDRPLVTDEKGLLEEMIPADAHRVTLVINDAQQTAFAGTRFGIRIGDLDPVEKVTGQAARLANLGYYFEDLVQIDAVEFPSAVEEFQCDYALTVDGVCGPRTQTKLKEVHGS